MSRAARRALLGLGAALLVAATLRSPSARATVPAGRFVDQGDGTVRDAETGLVWQRVSPPLTVFTSAEDAIAYCASGADLPGAGWRLPSVKELATLYDPTSGDEHLPRDVFPWPTALPADDPDATRYFTSTRCEQKTGGCYTGSPNWLTVEFRRSVIGTGAGRAYARCVRSP
jgi:hypothetical protein